MAGGKFSIRGGELVVNAETGVAAGVLIGGLAIIALVGEVTIMALVGELKQPFEPLGEGE